MSNPSASQNDATLQAHDLIASLPAPVLRLLVLFARPISAIRVVLEVLCWRSGRRVDSWLVIAGWWGICLGSKYAFRWLLPLLIFAPILPLERLRVGRRTTLHKQSAAHPTTQETLLVTLSDLHSIHSLLPPSPVPSVKSVYSRFEQLGPLRLTRGLLVIWVTWLSLGRLIGFQALLAILGSIVLLLPSPPLAHALDILSRSLFIRRAITLIFLFTFGSPPAHSYPLNLQFSPVAWFRTKWATSRRPSLAYSIGKPAMHQQPSDSAIDDNEGADMKTSEPIYFRFEVHENQRWWMGLDWTSALLPQERPSWCDSHLLPTSPPASYPLPDSASIILPSPTKDEPNGRVKRVASWRWLDDDWSIIRAGPKVTAVHQSPILEEDAHLPTHQPSRSMSSGFANSPPMPTSTTIDETSVTGVRAQSIAEQAFTKGLERLKARTASPAQAKVPTGLGMGIGASPSKTSGEPVRGRKGSLASEDAAGVDLLPPSGSGTGNAANVPVETIVDRDEATDADGWVYGDNKWENMGARGGLGRFTRRRRWRRRAVLVETVHRMPLEISSTSADPVTPLKASSDTALDLDTKDSVNPVSKENTGYQLADTPERTRAVEGMIIPPASPTRDDALRQRLKKAMGNMGG